MTKINIIQKKLGKIKLLLMDFDGVLTDGFVYVNGKGEESVKCSRKDGLGISMLKRAGFGVGVISKETNQVVSVRCKKMGIFCFQKVSDGEEKLKILKRVQKEFKISTEETAYMGDDLQDIPILKYVGCAIAVADAHPQVKKSAHFVTCSKGGDHAVREICEMILQAKGIKIEY
ncbi:hypothetical protein A2Y99_01225 [Candidatus Gottesmanbacteria bacterium RBG_13_37_7]|uniref:3-deoxy-D-manno-octulosonate 8-phosphate phosphatase n=1 Tax=Candidatus Gottesmanbacteria bacterium RBG_13_37_7 TaxID=1798369 RepID=A0A1F5YH10_9BACT|nr:MAG: hypothetical protein A2Y99_01225 [Candidatus Gottesmanbacteria bacterium RBG_13_37_7]